MTGSIRAAYGSDELTVMMPARNAEATVEHAVTSTLRDLPSDSKMVVLDDASDDNTAKIVARIANRDSRLTLIRAPSNLGIPAASNALLEAARTRLVARMDADDITIRGRFRRQLRAIQHTDFHFSSAIFYGPGRLVEPVPVLGTTPQSSLLELLVHDPFFHSGFMGRRDVMTSLGGYRDVPSEDWDMFLRLGVEGGTMIRSAVPGVFYRRHAPQITKNEAWKAAVVNSTDMAHAHDDLCRTVMGETSGAFRALAGEGATEDEARRANWLISRVEHHTQNVGGAARASLRVTTHGVRLRLHRRYSHFLDRAQTSASM